jgi:hypothetical protein
VRQAGDKAILTGAGKTIIYCQLFDFIRGISKLQIYFVNRCAPPSQQTGKGYLH